MIRALLHLGVVLALFIAALAFLIFIYGVFWAVPYNPAKDPKMQGVGCAHPIPGQSFELITPDDCSPADLQNGAHPPAQVTRKTT